MSPITDTLCRIVGAPHAPGRVQAICNGTVIADSDRTVVVERNHYFPPENIRDHIGFWHGVTVRPVPQP